MPAIPAAEEEQEECCKVKAGLVYTRRSRPIRASLKNQNKKSQAKSLMTIIPLTGEAEIRESPGLQSEF